MDSNPSKKGKTVLFLCKCSSNVSSMVDFDSVKEWARDHGDVNIVAVNNLLCSPAGKKFYADVIRGKDVDSVVVAACSPKLHEKTFQELAEQEGINLARVHMANIREQCAWVTTDPKEATEKAKKLINAAIRRSRHSQDLEKKTMKVFTDVLVIGGGMAGMEAARRLSRAGRTVHIVEKNISLGGFIMKTEDIAPTMECSPCLMAPILADVRDDPNIRVYAGAEVASVTGFFGNFTAVIRKKARYVEESCIGCEECFPGCPVSVPSEFHHGLGNRKAIHMLFPGSVPAAAVIDRGACRHFIDGSCDACAKICPFHSVNFEQQDEEITVQAGSVVLAVGFENGAVERYPELGRGRLENVYTTPELERLASSNGPTGGAVLMKNGRPPESVAVIHCAGSLRDDGIPYCSGICCTNAIKAGELVRKKNPGVKIINIHNDLVFNGPVEFELQRAQKKKGTAFIKCRDLLSVALSEAPEGKIEVSCDEVLPFAVDMVVLSTGLLPGKSMKELSGMLNADIDGYGYLRPDHAVLHTTGSSLDGIYTAGCASSPVNAPGAVTQAQAVAGDILGKLVPDREIELEAMTACIDQERCAGCRLCIASCPYKAITYDRETRTSRVNEAICRGCGTCAATCPSGACSARHFSDEELYAEIGGLLDD